MIHIPPREAVFISATPTWLGQTWKRDWLPSKTFYNAQFSALPTGNSHQSEYIALFGTPRKN